MLRISNIIVLFILIFCISNLNLAANNSEDSIYFAHRPIVKECHYTGSILVDEKSTINTASINSDNYISNPILPEQITIDMQKEVGIMSYILI